MAQNTFYSLNEKEIYCVLHKKFTICYIDSFRNFITTYIDNQFIANNFKFIKINIYIFCVMYNKIKDNLAPCSFKQTYLPFKNVR